MIRYALRCAKGHDFESWFQSSSAYDSQRKRKLVTCPVCDGSDVDKAIMAPKIVKKVASGRGKERREPAVVETPADNVALLSTRERELRAKLKALRDHITSTADDVGTAFPTEARKMHYGEIEHRPIYGAASSDEAKALIEEGVEVAPIPMLPDDRN